jgi:hypothetical protein
VPLKDKASQNGADNGELIGMGMGMDQGNHKMSLGPGHDALCVGDRRPRLCRPPAQLFYHKSADWPVRSGQL